MASEEISRRNLFPGLVAGAAAVALPALLAAEKAEAADGRTFAAVAGPLGLSAGQTLTSSLMLLPAVQKVREAAARFRLSLYLLDGDGSVRLLASPEFFVKAGGGALQKVQVLADGSVRVGEAIAGQISPGGDTQIIAILIGLLLPAVQRAGVAATLQVADQLVGDNGEPGGHGPTRLLLPYIEQDNIF